MANDRYDNEPPPGERLRHRSAQPTARELSLRAELIQVRHELKNLLDDLHSVTVEKESQVQSAVVTAVVSRTALMHHGRGSSR